MNTFTRKTSKRLLTTLVRVFCVLFLIGAGGGVAVTYAQQSQESLDVFRGGSSNNTWSYYEGTPSALYHHFSREAYGYLEKRDQEIRQIHTEQALLNWQEDRRLVLHDLVGQFPERTSLNPQITRTVQGDGFKVQNILFESMPGYRVTSSLFIPDSAAESPAPAILYGSGHTTDAYRHEPYQHLILNLVEKGFVVFAIDPVGQGERLEYLDPEAGVSSAGGPTAEHAMPGAQTFISGSSLARYMIWDGIRAVDYLLTRPEVDPERIGITGMSGGGTQAAYIAALDPRIHAAAPSNYITSFTRLLQTIGPQDSEQNFLHGIRHGIDHGDLLAVRAPAPTLVLSTTNDFFSIQGAAETTGEVKNLYRILGAENDFEWVYDEGGHTVTRQNREAIYRFFQEHLNPPGDPADQDVQILDGADLQVTETGHVALLEGGRTTSEINREESEQLTERLVTSRSGEDVRKHIDRVKMEARRLSGYQEPRTTLAPLFTGQITREGYTIEKYLADGEGKYALPFLLLRPDQPNGEGVLYLHADGKSAEMGERGDLEWLVSRGYTVLVPDLIGVGEALSDRLRAVWRAGVQIGRSITGVQAADLVSLQRWFRLFGEVIRVHAISVGEISPTLMHAALFEPTFESLLMVEPLVSWRDLVDRKEYRPELITWSVPAALTSYDLPDLVLGAAPVRTALVNPLRADGEPAGNEMLERDYGTVQNYFSELDHSENFAIVTVDRNDRDARFGRWFK